MSGASSFSSVPNSCLHALPTTDRVLYPPAAARSPPGSGLIIRRSERPPVTHAPSLAGLTIPMFPCLARPLELLYRPRGQDPSLRSWSTNLLSHPSAMTACRLQARPRRSAAEALRRRSSHALRKFPSFLATHGLLTLFIRARGGGSNRSQTRQPGATDTACELPQSCCCRGITGRGKIPLII